MPDVYICQVTGNKNLTDSVYILTIICDEIAKAARAGQFVSVKCGEGLVLRRPVSIGGISGNKLDLIYEIKGEGTRRLSEYLPGDKLDVLGPLGNGFNMPDGSILAVGGGIGTPPLLFAAETANGDVTALLGFRDSSRIILKSKFETACREVHITTDDGSFGIPGTVADLLERFLKQGAFDAVLACGPRAMLYSAAKLCKQYSVPCQVSMEERMGCGVGACLVCACGTIGNNTAGMRRVCKDGPVFDAEEIAWTNL